MIVEHVAIKSGCSYITFESFHMVQYASQLVVKFKIHSFAAFFYLEVHICSVKYALNLHMENLSNALMNCPYSHTFILN
jgi:hypothetical protein